MSLCVCVCVCVCARVCGDDMYALHVFFLFQSAVYVAVCVPVHWWVHVYVLFMWIGLGGCLCQLFRKFVEVL